MNYNISQTLSDRAREMPERTGLISKKFSGYQYWSFQQLHENTNCYANALTRIGVKRGIGLYSWWLLPWSLSASLLHSLKWVLLLF